MNASRHREIACAIIIDTSAGFVGILHPGNVGLFADRAAFGVNVSTAQSFSLLAISRLKG
jgi:hypothetical protein